MGQKYNHPIGNSCFVGSFGVSRYRRRLEFWSLIAIILFEYCSTSVVVVAFSGEEVGDGSTLSSPATAAEKININNNNLTKLSDYPVLIVISFDGFRYNYFDRPETGTPNLNMLKSKGSSVPYMKNQFVTKTFPNHMSIATGLYVESHGVVDNWFFDPKYNKTLNETNEELWNFDNHNLPLWTLNELAGQGRRSGVMMWPGSEHTYGVNNTVPSKMVHWNDTVAFEWRIDQVVSWITDEKEPVNLVYLYFEEPDEIAHAFGPNSQEVTDVIQRLDNITGYLIHKLEDLHIFNRVNLIFLSDHGFEEIKQEHIINITDLVNPLWYDTYGTSPVLNIRPKPGKLEEVYNGLKKGSEGQKFTVYRKEDLPESWFYASSRRIMPIVLVADLGYVFDSFRIDIAFYNKKYNRTENVSNVYGAHGYDNKVMPMHPFFLAHGPLFRSGFEAEPFENIDLFSLICKIMKISTPPNNGTLSHTEVLLGRKGFSFTSPVGWVLGAAIIFGLTILLGIMSLMVSKRRTRHHPLLKEGGYRFINKREPCEDTPEDLQSAKQYVNVNGVQIHPDKEEYQALLMSSSTEEL